MLHLEQISCTLSELQTIIIIEQREELTCNCANICDDFCRDILQVPDVAPFLKLRRSFHKIVQDSEKKEFALMKITCKYDARICKYLQDFEQ